MEPIETLSVLSTAHDYNSISEESDDIDTPLEVWQRLVGKYQPEQGVFITQKNDASDEGSVSAKRKSRHRVCSRDAVSNMVIYEESSSDAGESEKSKPRPPKRRLRSRKSKIEVKSVSKQDKNKSVAKSKVNSKRKVTNKRQDDFLKDSGDSSPFEEFVKSCSSFSPLRRSKRRSARNRGASKNRKRPIEFADDVSTKRNIEKAASSEEEIGDDSQRTILLDTPELLDSMEILEDAKNSDADSFEPDEKDSCPEKDEFDFGDNRTNYENDQQSTISNKTKSSPDQKIVSNPVSNEKTCMDTSRVIDNSFLKCGESVRSVTKLPEMQSTELDDIFFKSHSSSPKKPPPTRWKEQSGNSSATTAFDSGTQESTCSSLWDDDTLWVAK